MKRNGYIDVIKFIFAIIIAEFHLGTGLFPGGRVAVDGFFMISAYLMMGSLQKADALSPDTGISTVKFIFRKYKGLLWTLLVSAAISFAVDAIARSHSSEMILERLPMLAFEIFPLNTAGFKGTYVVGISWYLSSMFIALAILYPLIKKFRTGFTLTFCPLCVLLGYGLLSARYGHIAVGSTFLENSILHTGILRALAGSSAGVLVYEITARIEKQRFTVLARTVFTVAETVLFVATVALMHHYPKSRFDYLLVFLLFALLIIGISGISYSSCLLRAKWLGILGTASTLIVLNHYAWCLFLQNKYPTLDLPEKVLVYIALVAVTSVVVQLLSLLLSRLSLKIFRKSVWIKEN